MLNFQKVTEKLHYYFIAYHLKKLVRKVRTMDPLMGDFMEQHLVMDPKACTFMWKSPKPEDPDYDEFNERLEQFEKEYKNL